jgi:glucose dehydrogenase
MAVFAGLAAVGSAQYVRLAGLAALLTGVMLLAARMARLGDYTASTVLAKVVEAFHAADVAPRSTRVDDNPVEDTGISGDEKAL